MKKLLCLILAIAMVLGTMSTVVFADAGVTLEVGADKEYTTIGEAYKAANDGDIISVSAGEYNIEDPHIYKAVSIIGDEADKPVVNGRFYVEIASGAFNVENLAFTTTDDAIQIRNCADATVSVKNCDFSGISKNMAAINVAKEVANVIVEGCVFNKGIGGNYVAFTSEGGTITGTFIMKDCDASKAGRTAYLGNRDNGTYVENAYFENNVQGSATKVKVLNDINTLTFAGSGAGVGDWTGSVSKLVLKDGATLTVPAKLGFTATLVNGESTTYCKTLQDAIDAAAEGDNTITLLADCDEDVTVTQNEGINITLDGAENDFTGTIYIHGRARYTGSETLTIQNFNFTTEEDAHDFISSNSTGEIERYAHNVTIVDCDFTATEESTAVVATRFRQAYNIVMENCTATNLHSAMWATGGTNVDVTGLTATNCKEGGLSFGTTTPATVTNSTITTAAGDLGYGIRVDGSSGAELTVEGCTIDAFVPVIMRNTTSTDNAVTVTNSELTASNPYGYEVGVVKTDYLKATDTFAPADVSVDLVIDDSYKVSTGVWDGVSVDTSWYNTTDKEFTITSAAAFAGFAAIANGTADGIAADTFAGKTVKLGVDIDLGNYEWAPIGGRTSSTNSGQIECTFDGQGHTISNLKVEKGADYVNTNMNIGLFGITRTGNFVAKNFTLENVDIYGSASVAAVLGRTVNVKAVIDNVDVIGDIKIEASTQNVGAICAQGYVPVITNCNVIGNDGSYIKAGTGQVGGILGWSGESTNATTVTDCSVENVTISAPEYVGAIAAIIQYGATVKNNTVENVTLNVLEGAENNEYHYGTIIGSTGAGYVANNGKGTLPVYISGNTTENVAVTLNGAAVENPVEFGAHYDGTSYLSARIGDAYYENLQVAIDAAKAGETIIILDDIALTAQNANAALKPAYNRESYAGLIIPDDKAVTIDLNGKTISYVDEYGDCDNVAILNLGNLTINDSVGDGKITYKPVAGTTRYAYFYSTIFNCGTLTVNGGTIENTAEAETDVTNAVDNHSRLSHEYGNDCILTVNGGKLTGAYYYAIRQYTHYFEGVKNRVTINDGTIEGGIYMQHGDSWYYADPSKKRLNVDGYLTINGGNFIATTTDNFNVIKSRLANPDNNEWGLEINGGTFNDASIQLMVQRGVYYTNGVSGATTPAEATGTRNAEWLEKNGGFISGGTFANMGDLNDATTNLQSFLADGFDLYRTANGYVVVDEEFEDTAEEINVVYKDVTPEGTEGKKVYEIVVKANDGEEINELASVDLSFEFTKRPIENGNIDITVLPAKDFAMTRYEDADRYMFNYNGTSAHQGSGNAIPVGTITVEGYGSFSIATAQAGTNVVNATTLADNLVDSYTTDGAEDKDLTTGALVINESIDNEYVGTVGETTIAVPVRDLAIDIAFKNAVENQSKAYQDMKVVISGGDLAENIEIELGSDWAATGLEIAGKADAAVDVAYANNAYTVAVTDALTLNRAYTVTVSGAGYRTARYTVTMTDDKELSFWNNVMDNDTAVEEGEFETTKTFLAGDIVKDNDINIYDLSAVVSYFGSASTTENGYAKYDLDRNGVIDSRDVAYVLVSWGE